MKKELGLLREYMKENDIDAYIIPSSDPHQGEYVAEHFHGRKWLTGFTGSAGISVVLKDEAGVWTDGRYHIQAENELRGSGFDLYKSGEPGVPAYDQWLADKAYEGMKIAFDGRVISQKTFLDLDSKMKDSQVEYDIHRDALSEIWDTRPSMPAEMIEDYPLDWAGESREDKIEKVRNHMRDLGGDMCVYSSLDDIAWLLNLRGSDVRNTPLFYSYLIVEEENTILFTDMGKIEADLEDTLNEEGVDILGYDEVADYLLERSLGKKIICDPATTSRYIYSFLEEGEVIETKDLTSELKAVKNKVEIEHIKNAYLKDCVALTKFACYLEEHIDDGIDENKAEEILYSFREEGKDFRGNSFDPIAGYGKNAAMMHYKSSKDTAATIERRGFFLIDSGGQYLDGTTDITRTLVVGELTHEEKRDFTLALRGVIDLSTTRFLKGTTGYALDAICRRPMWNAGLDYKCGTGHGIGYFLNIHEGPCGFGQREGYNNPLKAGNLITIEPGVYKEGRHGIRHENTVVIQESMKGEFGEFYEMENITYFPIDTRGILVEELSMEQREWLNSYHREVFEKIAHHVDGKVLNWLRERTTAI